VHLTYLEIHRLPTDSELEASANQTTSSPPREKSMFGVRHTPPRRGSYRVLSDIVKHSAVPKEPIILNLNTKEVHNPRRAPCMHMMDVSMRTRASICSSLFICCFTTSLWVPQQEISYSSISV
jgi:hypothetical protein